VNQTLDQSLVSGFYDPVSISLNRFRDRVRWFNDPRSFTCFHPQHIYHPSKITSIGKSNRFQVPRLNFEPVNIAWALSFGLVEVLKSVNYCCDDSACFVEGAWKGWDGCGA
jgi:hypothetical protein